MDKDIRKFTKPTDLDEIKAEEYRYWQSRPMHERMEAVSQLSSAMYGIKGDGTDVPRLDKTFARIERRHTCGDKRPYCR
jgi:hypothetical protein